MWCGVSQVLEGLSGGQLGRWLADVNSASREDLVPLMLWTSRSRDELVLQLEQLRQLGLETLPEALITDAGAAVGGAWKGRRHSLYNLLWQGAL